jgi:membrane fusion protein, multidrug efflux system
MKLTYTIKHEKTVKQVFLHCFIIAFSFAVFSCTNSTSETSTQSKDVLPPEKNLVDTMIVRSQDFYREIVSNGKLSAVQKAELYFRTTGIIDLVNIRSGAPVSAGQVLARLQTDEAKLAYERRKAELERTRIDRLDRLLGMGYTSEDSAAIQPEHMNIAGIRSGYTQALINYREAQNQLQHTTLTAPFSGKAEGVVQKPYEKTDLSKPFCTLINDRLFAISFPLLETEVGLVSLGQEVEVTPIAVPVTARGRITEINPRIDANGLAWLSAEVANPGGYLEGMNVKVSIKRVTPNQLVVPKQAVVLRQNREVLFRFTGEGVAFWTYLNLQGENEHSYSVQAADGARLEPGDTIIISNNLNLAHESVVEVR